MTGVAPAPTSPTLTVVDETDGYTSALAGVTAEAVRIGKGTGPNVVLAAPDDEVTTASVRYGFPITAGLHVPDDRILAAYIHDAPSESKWCGVPLRAGRVMLYPPGSDHFAVARSGLHLTYVVAEPEQLMDVADRRGIRAELSRSRGLLEIPASPATRRMGATLTRRIRAASHGEPLQPDSEPVLAALAALLERDAPAIRHGFGRGLDSRQIVGACIDYAEAVDRLPTVAALCATSHVSERRLRSAFHEEFDRSPTRFFRAWALERAHRRLRDAGPADCTVTGVALDLGFDHLGRFAGYYRDVYGEPPSVTLQTA